MLRKALKRKRVEFSSTDTSDSRSNVPLGKKTTEELELEKAVLGDDEHIVHTLQTTFKTKVTKRDGCEKPAPAWSDEEDCTRLPRCHKEEKPINTQARQDVDIHQYEIQLKNEFHKVSGSADWAKLKWQKKDLVEEEKSDEEGSSLIRSTGNYLEGSDSLPRNILELKPCTDANKHDPSEAKLTSVEFHPHAQVMLTAGMDHRLSLFEVDGKDNAKIQSIFFKTFPIYKARFTRDGNEVILSSRLKSFYYYDMKSGSVINVPKIKGLEENYLKQFEMSPDGKFIVFLGQYGHMHFLSAKTKELIDTVKMNGSVESVAFSPDSSKMYSHGDDGEVYIWDMNRRQCVHRFTDDGCVKGTAVAASSNGQYLATGSYSGVVNVYDVHNAMMSRRPKPVKAIMNLTSPCTQLKFNPATEILAASSNFTENAIKLVHLPSMSVFQNFPDTTNDRIRIAQCLDFSLRGGYFSVANHKGRALLYRVKHYKDF